MARNTGRSACQIGLIFTFPIYEMASSHPNTVRRKVGDFRVETPPFRVRAGRVFGYHSRRFVRLSRVPASTVGVFMGVLPVGTALLSYAKLGESLWWAHRAEGVCALLAILLIRRRRPAKEEAASSLPA